MSPVTPSAPDELLLDIDASEVPVHGAQEASQFHAYYDHHCYLPLYLFCGKVLLACMLRPSRIDGAQHAAAVIKLIVQWLRLAWPSARIIVRGDSGFCRQRLLRWCERSNVGYLIGLARNARLEARVALAEMMLKDDFERSQDKQQLIDEFSCAADRWNIERRVLTPLEYDSQGVNPRFMVTKLEGHAAELYDDAYCARGEAERRSKEAQLDLFGTRASCHEFAANQLRLRLAALPYSLIERPHATALSGTELARATAATIRVRLLKIGAAIVRNTRRVRVARLASPDARRVRVGRALASAIGPWQCCPRHVQATGVGAGSSAISEHPLPTRTQTPAHRCTPAH